MSLVADFGNTARGLAKNPLGIIALFIVLVYAFAALVVGASSTLGPGERAPLVWFLVVFPNVVLLAFVWLVSCHHSKLYAPSDFKREELFLEAQRPELTQLPFAAPQAANAVEAVRSDEAGESTLEQIDLTTPEGRAAERANLYISHRGLFLVHVIEPSVEHGQEYDIFIYLIRHKSDDFSDIAAAEFFLGHYWGNKIFRGRKIGKVFGVKTAAYGPFLCTCRIRFKDGEEVTVYRYIDFEMGALVKDFVGS